jgi:hypothetical protein
MRNGTFGKAVFPNEVPKEFSAGLAERCMHELVQIVDSYMPSIFVAAVRRVQADSPCPCKAEIKKLFDRSATMTEFLHMRSSYTAIMFKVMIDEWQSLVMPSGGVLPFDTEFISYFKALHRNHRHEPGHHRNHRLLRGL